MDGCRRGPLSAGTSFLTREHLRNCMSDRPPVTPLLRPRAYFARRDDALRSGLAVYVAYVALLGVSMYAVLRLVRTTVVNAPPGFESALADAFGTIFLAVLVVSVLALLSVAAVMHWLTGGSDRIGPFRDTVAVAAWAYAPNALSLPVEYLLFRYELSGATFHGSDPATLEAQLEALERGAAAWPSILLSALVVLWSVYILAYGTAGTHDVAVSRAALPAGAVGLVALLLGL